MKEESGDLQILKQIPAEISRIEVGNLIANLPALSASSAWGGLFNFNTIIMSSITLIAVVCGGLFLQQFNASDRASDQIALMEIKLPEISNGASADDEMKMASLGLLPFQNDTIKPKEQKEIIKQSYDLLETDSVKNIRIPQKSKLIPQPSNGDLLSGPNSLLISTPSSLVESSSVINGIGSEDSIISTWPEINFEPIDSIIPFNGSSIFEECAGNGYIIFGCSDHSNDLGVIRIKSLQRKLTRQLVKDGLIEDKKERVCIKVLEDKLVLNGQAMSVDFEPIYRDILLDYQVIPGEHKQIQMNRRYVAVGNFEGDNFVGVGRGTFIGWKSQEELKSSPNRFTSWE